MTRSWRSLLLVVALVATIGLPLVLAAAQTPAQPAPQAAAGASQEHPEKPVDGAKPAPEKAAPAPGDLLDVDLEGPILSARTWRRFARDLFASFIAFLPALFRALIVVVAVYLFYRAVTGVLHGMMRRANADPAVHEIGLRLVRYVLLGLGVIMALAQLGFDVASVLAGLGIVGLAVGLAAQETLANLIAGLTLLWDRPFRIGDNVTIADTFGQVQQIGLRTTRILTVDRLDAILPNKDVINEKIINHTLNPQLRLPVPLSIAYKEDTREARKVLLAAVAGHPMVLDDPPPRMVVTNLGESSVDLELRVWLKDPFSERDALMEMLELSKIALDEAGIEIPFPQRTLHFAGGAVRLEGGGGRGGVEGGGESAAPVGGREGGGEGAAPAAGEEA